MAMWHKITTHWKTVTVLLAGLSTLTIRYLSITAGIVTRTVPEYQIDYVDGHQYRVNVHPPDNIWAVDSDSNSKPRLSELVILEDGTPLATPHAVNTTIREQGAGRYSHWNKTVYFSASDNTDPRENGRSYEIRYPPVLQRWTYVPVILLDFVVLALAVAAVQRRLMHGDQQIIRPPKTNQTTLYTLTVINSGVLLVFVLLALLLVASNWDVLKDKGGERVEQVLSNSEVARALTSFADSMSDDPESQNSDSAFSHYKLYIKAKHMRQIRELSTRLVAKGVMSSADRTWFPARFIANDQVYPVKVRMRGDAANHWKNAKKSWRLRFKKDHLFEGLREMNLVIPEDKSFEIEQVAYAIARDRDLLVPRSGFVRMSLNDQDFGLYFWFEQGGKELLEVTKRSGGDIIRDSNVWLDAISINLESDTLIGLPSFYRNTFRDESVVTQVATRWRELLELITDDGISDSEFERITPTYVDMERFIRWNAIATLFGSRHALAASNVRWYYDSSRGLFEPILYDVSSQSLGEFGGDPVTGEFRTTFEPLLSNPLVKRLLLIPSVMQRRNRYLWNLLHEIDVAAMLETEYERIRPFYAERKIKEDLAVCRT